MDKGHCQDGRNTSAPFYLLPQHRDWGGGTPVPLEWQWVCADCMHGVHLASTEKLGDMEDNYCHAHRVKCRKSTLVT